MHYKFPVRLSFKTLTAVLFKITSLVTSSLRDLSSLCVWMIILITSVHVSAPVVRQKVYTTSKNIYLPFKLKFRVVSIVLLFIFIFGCPFQSAFMTHSRVNVW